MRWSFPAALAVAATLFSPSVQAVEPAAPQPPPTVAADEAIGFEQYRDWRLHYVEQRREQLAARLALPDLSPAQKARLEDQKAYYDWQASQPEADRDRRFRERFDRIDANHDGRIDRAERAAWRERQRAFYNRGEPGERSPPARRQAAAMRDLR